MRERNTPKLTYLRSCPVCDRPVTGTIISGPDNGVFRPCGHYIHPVKLVHCPQGEPSSKKTRQSNSQSR